MKGNFWRKIFRKGYNAHGYHSVIAEIQQNINSIKM